MAAVGSVLQTIKTVGVIFPQALKNSGSTADWVGGKDSTPVSVDTLGFNSARVVFMLGAEAATLGNMNVYEADDDSTYTEIPGLDFIADASADPGAGTDSNKLYACYIDLRDKKRYLQLDLSAGAGDTYAVAWVDLYDADEVPSTDADRGIAESLSA